MIHLVIVRASKPPDERFTIRVFEEESLISSIDTLTEAELRKELAGYYGWEEDFIEERIAAARAGQFKD